MNKQINKHKAFRFFVFKKFLKTEPRFSVYFQDQSCFLILVFTSTCMIFEFLTEHAVTYFWSPIFDLKTVLSVNWTRGRIWIVESSNPDSDLYSDWFFPSIYFSWMHHISYMWSLHRKHFKHAIYDTLYPSLNILLHSNLSSSSKSLFLRRIWT